MHACIFVYATAGQINVQALAHGQFKTKGE